MGEIGLERRWEGGAGGWGQHGYNYFLLGDY